MVHASSMTTLTNDKLHFISTWLDTSTLPSVPTTNDTVSTPPSSTLCFESSATDSVLTHPTSMSRHEINSFRDDFDTDQNFQQLEDEVTTSDLLNNARSEMCRITDLQSFLIAEEILAHARARECLRQFTEARFAVDSIGKEAKELQALAATHGVESSFTDIICRRRRAFMATPYFRKIYPMIAEYEANFEQTSHLALSSMC